KTAANFEMVDSEFYFKDYGKSVFHALKLLHQYPDNNYLHGMVGKCLYLIYEAQKKHEVGKYVSVNKPDFSKEYNQLLTFIYALRLSEISNVGYYFLAAHYNPKSTNEDLIYAYWQF